MDFSQFLVSNPEIPNVKEIKGKIPVSDKPKKEDKLDKPKKEDKPDKPKKTPKTNDKSNTENKQKKEKVIDVKSVFKQQQILEEREVFKRGDFVKIIRLEDSPLNVYKGYFGEIKEYIQRSDSAYIVLEAMAYPRRIKFPLGHFVRRNF